MTYNFPSLKWFRSFISISGVVSGFPQTIERESNDLLTLNSETESHHLGIYNGNSTTMNTHRYLVGSFPSV